MKAKMKIIAVVAFVLALASCATNSSVPKESGSIFDCAYMGVLPSYTDYLEKGRKFEVSDPYPADESIAKRGWKKHCFVSPAKDDSAYKIEYLEDGEEVIAYTVNIKRRTDDLFLGKYIGKPKNALLKDFPLGESDTDKGFVIYYESDDVLIAVMLDDGTVKNIYIQTKHAVSKSLEPESDFPESLPSLPHEQLEKILDEIVMHEEHIIARGESGEPVELETFAYMYAHGNTYLVSEKEDSPYYYIRLKKPDSENGTPNLIAVMYARPTRENMRYFSHVKDTFIIIADERDLDYDSEEIAEAYKKINREPITWRTSVKIAGDTYEVFFTDIDDDQDEDSEADYDMYDDEDDSLDAEESEPLTTEDYIALADAAIERERAGSYDADAEQDGGMYTRQVRNNRFFLDADFDGKAVYLSQTIKTDGGRNVIVIFCMKYSLGVAFSFFELGRHLESAEESDSPATDEEIDEFVSEYENDHAYKTEAEINGKAFTVYVVRGDE